MGGIQNDVRFLEGDMCGVYVGLNETQLLQEQELDEQLLKVVAILALAGGVGLLFTINPAQAADKVAETIKTRTWTEFWMKATGADIVLNSKESLLKRGLQLSTTVNGVVSLGSAGAGLATGSLLRDGSFWGNLYYWSTTNYVGSIILDRFLR